MSNRKRKNWYVNRTLFPLLARIITALEATPGVITDSGLRWLLWERVGRKSPNKLDSYMSHIQRITGRCVISCNVGGVRAWGLLGSEQR